MDQEIKTVVEQPRYRCAACNVPVIMFEGEIHRPCSHKDAAVVVNISATCTGESKVNE